MQSTDEQISRIQSKLQELLKKYAISLKDAEQQQKIIVKLREQQELNLQKIKMLEEQQYILKASSGKMNDPERKEFEQAINKYIKDIDKCIGLLSE